MATPSLNQRFTFETFVVGRQNEAARNAAKDVLRACESSKSPLCIHGGVGSGKTHLLHAIGNALSPDKRRVFYRTSEDFVNGAISASRAGNLDAFRLKIENLDLLLLDDIQMFEGKAFVQRELVVTLDTLHDLGRQVVVTSNAILGELRFSDRLKDRLKSGLVISIAKPDLDFKVRLIEAKAAEKKLNLTSEVAIYVAMVSETAREIEGALNQILARLSIDPHSIDLTAVKRTLGKEIPARPLTMERIIAAVSKHFFMSPVTMKKKSNTAPIVEARSIAMFSDGNLLTSLSRKSADVFVNTIRQ